MAAKRRDKGSKQREIEQLQVRDVMTQDMERGHMPDGCSHIGKTCNFDSLDLDQEEAEEVLCE